MRVARENYDESVSFRKTDGRSKSQYRIKSFVAFGPGFCGDYDSLEEAQAVVDKNENGAVYKLVRKIIHD